MSVEIGNRLRQAREQRSLSLDEVARATLMRKHYLLAMEAGDFEFLLGGLAAAVAGQGAGAVRAAATDLVHGAELRNRVRRADQDHAVVQ